MAKAGTALGKRLGEVFPLDQGRDEIRLIASFAGVEDRNEVGMPQHRRAASLAHKPLGGAWRIEQTGAEPLEGHRAAQQRVPCTEDHTKRPLADHFVKLIPAEPPC